jgi:hypothetical protein
VLAAEEISMNPFDKLAADRMAAAIDHMVALGVLDARSPAADARLDYGEPFDPETAKSMFFDCMKAPEQPHPRTVFYSLEAAKRHMLELYRRRINDRLTAAIVQLVARGSDQAERERSQFLALVLEDEANGRWISLRLSSFRKVLKFVRDMKFEQARRLRDDEKRNLDGKRDRKGWLGRLGDQVKADLEALFDKKL